MDESLRDLVRHIAEVEKDIEEERQARLAAIEETAEIRKRTAEIRKRTAEADARYVKAIEETRNARLELCQLLREETARWAKSYSTCRNQHLASVRYGCV